MIITYQPAATSTLPAREGRRSSAALCSRPRRDPRSGGEDGMRNFEAMQGLKSQIHLSVGSRKVKVDHEHENRPNKMTTYLKERKEWCLTWYQDKDPRTIWVGAPKRWKLTTMTKFPNDYLMEEMGVGLAVLDVRCEVLNSCWDSRSLKLVVHPSRGEKDSSYRCIVKYDRLWGLIDSDADHD